MATRVIAAQDKTSSGAGDDVQIKAGNANTSGAGGSIIIQPGAQATTGGNGLLIVRQPSGVAGTDEIQLSHDGGKGSVINKDGVLQLGGSHIALRTTANNAKTNLTAGTIYCDGIYSSNIINADGQTNDSYGWAIDSAGFNWNQGFNMRVGWSHIKGYANFGLAYTGDNTNGKRATLELTDGSTGGGAWAYRSSTTTVNTSYNDLNLSGHSAFQRLNATAATTITGIAPASTAGGSGSPTWVHSDGRVFWLYNIGTFNITLVNESASSTAGNRITTQTGANVVLGPGRMMQVVYDATSARWRATGETYPYVFPTADGTNGQVLTTNGSGTLSWTTVTSGGTVSGTTNYIAKFTGSTAVGNSLIYDDGSNVGIGTTSAQGRLDVVGANVYEPIRGITSSASNLESGANNALGLSVNNSNTTAGNGIAIGFNTATTNSTLYGVGAIGFNNLTHTTLGVPQGKFQVITRNSGGGLTPKLTIDTSGNVGIGTASPSNNLSIGASAGKIGFQRGSGDGEYALIGYKGTTGNDIYVFEINNTSGTGELRLNQGGTYNPIGMTFYTNNAEKMRIDSAGNVGIGTASPGAQLQVTSSAAATKGLIVKGAATQSANLTEWQDSTGAVVAAVSPTGAFTGSSFTPYGTFNSTTTIFGNNYWTPNYTGGVTSPSAGTYTKSTGNANTWDGQVYSSEGYTKNVYCAARASQTNGYIMFGLNSDPTTNADYGTLDYAWYFRNDGILQIYESGGAGSTYGAYTTSTVLSITYDGSNVQYWKDGVIQRTVARSTGNPLYFDTSFYTLSSSLNSVQFGPIGQPFGISGASGYLPKFTSQQTLGNSNVNVDSNAMYVNGQATSDLSGQIMVMGSSDNRQRITMGVNTTSGYGYIQSYLNTIGNYSLALNPQGGNVGIGTTSPYARFHVQQASAGSSVVGMILQNVGSTANTAVSLDFAPHETVATPATLARITAVRTAGAFAPTDLVFSTYNDFLSPGGLNERMRLNANGNLGIGTASPGAKLQVDTGATGTKGQIIKAFLGQTANLTEWQSSTATVLSAVNSAGDFTNTGGQAQSEKFGAGASVSDLYATAIGYTASASGQNSTALGRAASCTTHDTVAIGSSANAGGQGATAIGKSSTTVLGSISIGWNATSNGFNSVAIGRLCTAAATGGLAIGYNFTGAGLGYTSLCASTDSRSVIGAIDVYAGDGVNNGNISRQHSIYGTWATSTYASRLGRVQLRVNDYTTDREAIRYESDGANALTSIGGSAIIASTTLAVQSAALANKGLVVRGASGQTANLQEWQNNGGSAVAQMTASGSLEVLSLDISGPANGQMIRTKANGVNYTRFMATSANYNLLYGGPDGIGINNYADTVRLLNITDAGATTLTLTSASAKGLIVKGFTSQNANLQEWQNNGGTALAYMDANGNFFAVSKSFLIDHPTPAKAAEGKKLRYASLEGPENGVYFRGTLTGDNEIILPDYWKDLVDPESITVNLTPRKRPQPNLFVVDANAEKVTIESDREICCDFIVYGTRKDIAKLEVEVNGN